MNSSLLHYHFHFQCTPRSNQSINAAFRRNEKSTSFKKNFPNNLVYLAELDEICPFLHSMFCLFFSKSGEKVFDLENALRSGVAQKPAQPPAQLVDLGCSARAREARGDSRNDLGRHVRPDLPIKLAHSRRLPFRRDRSLLMVPSARKDPVALCKTRSSGFCLTGTGCKMRI